MEEVLQMHSVFHTKKQVSNKGEDSEMLFPIRIVEKGGKQQCPLFYLNRFQSDNKYIPSNSK